MKPAGKRATWAGDRAGPARTAARTWVKYARLPLLALAMFSLVAALWAGLLRLGLGLPAIQSGLYAAHGPLMVSGFLGTLISLERAVALGEGWAYGAPALKRPRGISTDSGRSCFSCCVADYARECGTDRKFSVDSTKTERLVHRHHGARCSGVVGRQLLVARSYSDHPNVLLVERVSGSHHCW